MGRASPALLKAGHRVITYDRRGFSRSSQPASGYDYDTFTADLDALVRKLDLHETTLAGHSMGTGEVTRYLGTYGSARVARGVLVSPIPPFLLQAGDNPEGVPVSVYDGFIRTAKADIPAWMTTFLNVFYSTGAQRDASVSDQAFQASWNLATAISATAAVACIATWETDFRADLRKIDVPMLVVRATQSRRCRSRRPASACRPLSMMSSSSPLAETRTQSRGRTPSRSIPRYCSSSVPPPPRPPADLPE